MITALDGRCTYAATGGAVWQDGQPLLCLLHGAAMDHTVWTLFSRYFARNGFNVWTPDIAGHGRSDGPLLPTIETMAEWLVALLARLDTPTIALAGHSMGSLMALEVAARLPERVTRLALLGTAYPMVVGDALLDAARADLPAAREMVAAFGHSFRARLGGNPVSGIHVVNTALGLMAKAGPGVMFNDLQACHQYRHGREAAAWVRARTTLILGSEDRMAPPKGAAVWVESIPEVTVRTIEGCGHMMMSEQPEATLRALRRAFVS